jgi:hypothetical protein
VGLHRYSRWLAAVLIVGAAALVVGLAVSEESDQEPGEEEAQASTFGAMVAMAINRLESLEGYRYTTILEVELPGAAGELGATQASSKAEGEVINPDRMHQVATSTLGGIAAEEEIVQLPEGDFIKRPEGYTEGLGELNTYMLAVPVLWSDIDDISHLLPDRVPGERDDIEGAEAVHYVAEDVPLLLVKDYVLRLFGAVESAAELPENYRVEFWISEEDGTLIRLDITGERIDAHEDQVRFRLESVIYDIGADFAINLQ